MIIYNVKVVKVDNKYTTEVPVLRINVSAPTFSSLQHNLYEEMDKHDMHKTSLYRIIFLLHESK